MKTLAIGHESAGPVLSTVNAIKVSSSCFTVIENVNCLVFIIST
jgi:hypothetical protein